MGSRFTSTIAAFALAAMAFVVPQQPPVARQGQPVSVSAGASILLYHRFGPVVRDEMTVRTDTFRGQLEYLKQHGYQVVALRAVVSHLLGKGPALPAGSVVITVDDGHASVFTEMLPIVLEHRVPVTLFIYPSAISNATYAMTWDQLTTLYRTVEGEGLSRNRERALCELPDRANTALIRPNTAYRPSTTEDAEDTGQIQFLVKTCLLSSVSFVVKL
jgi:Polysaccharide deacetylase